MIIFYKVFTKEISLQNLNTTPESLTPPLYAFCYDNIEKHSALKVGVKFDDHSI